jgi:hypothetical protein
MKKYGTKNDRARTYAESTPIEELLLKQRKGGFINLQEKERIKKYSESRRKENLQKKR